MRRLFRLAFLMVVVGLSALPWAAAEDGAKAADVTQIRVRELIYVLRQHRIFARADEWGSAIRELTKIGQPAVPELLLELRQTNRGNTMRGLLFTLRAIDDPRALPYVIDALPKAVNLSNEGSDCGLSFVSPDLMRFMMQNQNHPDREDFGYGRPINEIQATLHKLSQSAAADLAKKGVQTGPVANWAHWWEKLQAEGKVPAKDKSLELPARPEDLVERDGVRKFGPLFPTGAGRHLSPVAEVSLANRQIADAKSSIDLETGRAFEYLEGLAHKDKEKFTGADYRKWISRNSIDLDSYSENDLHLWLIDDRRWDTLEAEVVSGKPMDLGREVRSIWEFGVGEAEFGTFLFTTREGTRGVMRVHPAVDDGPARIEYRLWNYKTVPVAKKPPVSPGKPDEWQATKLVILKEPGFGNRCLFSLAKGERGELADTMFAPNAPPPMDELLRTKGSIFRVEQIAKWARGEGLDVTMDRARNVVEGVDNPQRPRVTGELRVLDARVQVTPDAFDTMSLARAKEVLARNPYFQDIAYLFPLPGNHNSPSTFLVETKSGVVSLISVLNVQQELTWIGFQVKTAAGKK